MPRYDWPFDRRGPDRLKPECCPACRQADLVATLRVEQFVYFRCMDCGFVWSVPKPRIVVD